MRVGVCGGARAFEAREVALSELEVEKRRKENKVTMQLFSQPHDTGLSHSCCLGRNSAEREGGS